MKSETWTPERDALLEQKFPSSWNAEIFRDINALPGPSLTLAAIKSHAKRRGIERDAEHFNQLPPAGLRPNGPEAFSASVWTDERLAWIKYHFPNTKNDAVFAALAAMPGATLTLRMVLRKAPKLGLKKSKEFTDSVRIAAQRSGRATQDAAAGRGGRFNFRDMVRGSALFVLPRTTPAPRVNVDLPSKSSCQFPLWGDREAPTHVYCGAAIPIGQSWCGPCRRRVFTRWSAAA